MNSNRKMPTLDDMIAASETLAQANEMMLPEILAICDRAQEEVENILKNCLPRGHANATQAMNEAWTLSDLLLQRRNNIAASLLILNPPAEPLT